MSTENKTAEFLDVTAPGSLPFIDFEISEFDELVAATEQLQGLGHSVVRTPAGPLVIGYDHTREILRDPDWITVLSGMSALQAVSYTHLTLPTKA